MGACPLGFGRVERVERDVAGLGVSGYTDLATAGGGDDMVPAMVRDGVSESEIGTLEIIT